MQLFLATVSVIGVAIGGVLLSNETARQQQDTRAMAVAGHLEAASLAAAGWIRTNETSLRSALPGDGSPQPVSYETIAAAGFLMGGASPLNAWGQRTDLWVRRLADGRVEGILVTTGGRPMPRMLASKAAANAGVGGAFQSGPAGSATMTAGTGAGRLPPSAWPGIPMAGDGWLGAIVSLAGAGESGLWIPDPGAGRQGTGGNTGTLGGN